MRSSIGTMTDCLFDLSSSEMGAAKPTGFGFLFVVKIMCKKVKLYEKM